MRRPRWLTAVALGTLLLAGAILVIRHSSVHTSGTEPLLARSSSAGYADPAVCGGCHSNIWNDYKRTGMARSFYRPTATDTVGAGKQSATFYHKASDSYFTIIERDGRFYQRRYRIGFDHKETNVVEEEIDFVMGSGNHVRTYLHRTSRDTLVELPLALYTEKGGYFAMNPGYDRRDHSGFRRNVSYDCMFCHNAIPEISSSAAEPGAEPVFPERLPEGIDCQRCHGPGRKHVQVAGTPGAKLKEIRAAIVNPARLSPERQMEVCMQCHLETTSFRLPNSIVRFDRGPFSYKPGEPLGDFMLHFDRSAGSEQDDRFEIVNAAYRLRKSACFLNSGGSLLCTTCHNPHREVEGGKDAARQFTQVCRQCHGGPFNQLVASGKHPRSDDCVGCHMPKRRTDDVVHVVMTDHYIQRRKPDRDLLAPIAERHETDANAYHGEVVLYYPPDLPKTPGNELYLAIAQVSQKSNMKAGLERLARDIKEYKPERPEYYLELADAWKASGQMKKALPLYEEAVRRKPDSLVALRKLGLSLRSSGRPARAVEILKRALAVAPADSATWEQLGLAYVDQGLKSDALAAFEKTVRLDADASEAYNSLGGVLFEDGDASHAESDFRAAIRIQPDYAEAHSNLGNVLSSAGRFEEARYHFQTALRLDPKYAAARYNYGVALARERRFDESQQQIEESIKIDPTVAEAHYFLANLLAAKGNTMSALAQYREAIKIRPDFWRAHLDMGALLAGLGDAAEALPHLRKAAESRDQSLRAEALQVLGQLGKDH